MSDRKDDSPFRTIAGLWAKTGNKGDFWGGSLDQKGLNQLNLFMEDCERVNLFIFPNQTRKDERQPHYNLCATKHDPNWKKVKPEAQNERSEESKVTQDIK